jgi:predicted RecA/RadA family phage recombinase
MGIKIHEYGTERTSLGADDYIDIDYWNGASYETAKIKGSAVRQTIKPQLFAQTENGPTISGTTAESSILGAGEGSLTVPADAFAVGDSFHVNINGLLNSANNEDITIRIKSGSVVLTTSGAINLPQCTNQKFELELDFTIRAIGAGGVAEIASAGVFNFNKDSSNDWQGQGFLTVNNTDFDTTSSNTLDITIQWGSTTVANQITSYLCVLNKTY